MSCLDLCYSVKLKENKAFKDEKMDERDPVVLHELVEKSVDKERTDSTTTVRCRCTVKPTMYRYIFDLLTIPIN